MNYIERKVNDPFANPTASLPEGQPPELPAAFLDRLNNLDPIVDLRLLLHNHGYEPIACTGKRPVGTEWTTRPNTPEAIHVERQEHPTADNTGLRTGRLVGIDIDLRDPKHANAIRELASEILGTADVERVGAKGSMLLYRNEKPIPKLVITHDSDAGTRPLVEILGTGQQLIAYGAHPDTGQPYTWENKASAMEPAQLPISKLPETEPGALRLFIAKAAEMLRETGCYQNVKVSDPGDPEKHAAPATERGDRAPVDQDYLIRMLRYVPPGMDRQKWISCIGGIQATNLRGVSAENQDDALLEIAQAWSRGDYSPDGRPSNWVGEDDVADTWRTMDPTRSKNPNGSRTGFGTLYHYAKENSFDEPPPQSTAAEAFHGYGDQQTPRQHDQRQRGTAGSRRRVNLVPMSEIKARNIDWLWYGHIARGALHLNAGYGGAGKTTIEHSFIATVSSGGLWPDGTRAQAGDVVYWTAEDDPAVTVKPQLAAMGADMNRVFIVKGIIEDDERERRFDPARDMETLADMCAQLPDLALITVSPVVNFVTGEKDTNRTVRAGLEPLVDLAQRSNVPVRGITHFRKDNKGVKRVASRVLDSAAYVNLPRMIHVCEQTNLDDDTAPRVFTKAKTNIAKTGGGFSYTLVQEDCEIDGELIRDVQRVVWGDALKGSAETLLNAEAKDDTKLTAAIRFIEEQLSSGSKFVTEIQAAANAHGHSWATVRRARETMGTRVVAKQTTGSARPPWYWHMPDVAAFSAPTDEVPPGPEDY